MADFLFSCGVIVDDERPRQHKPAQVRCMDEELLPKVVVTHRLCERCQLSPASDCMAHCAACRRDMMCAAKGKAFKRRHAVARALEHLRTVGWMAKTKQNAVTVDELIREGYARIATARDRARYGVDEDRVIVVEASRG